jgi:ABC-type antimicrobial peptide transport system permease subunit
VSRPSDALAEAAHQTSYNALILGLSGVALLVSDVGVANTMAASVLERRQEISLRRSAGCVATAGT